MVRDYLLSIIGKSMKVVGNINQNYSEEWSSHIHGILSAAKEGFGCSGRAESTPVETLVFSFSLFLQWYVYFHPPEQQSQFHRLKRKNNNKS